MARALHPKPAWVPDYIPALDGLRGLAILLVLFHHSEPRFIPLHLGWLAHWGWIGVNLFFVLSGFLITGIILEGRPRPRFFRNFYARRALRIWPVYVLVVPVNYLIFGRTNTWNGTGTWWLYFVFFVQNLKPGLTGTIFPSWSLAIEEQFYVVWAPVARRLPTTALTTLLVGVMALGPWARGWLYGWFVPINTLYHLDSLAVGALIALGLRATDWPLAAWKALAGAGVACGLMGWYYAWAWGGPFFDTYLGLGFGGVVLLALLGDGAAGGRALAAYARSLHFAPLRFLGKISYGLYMTHMLVFAYLGGIDAHMDRVHAGAAGDLVIVSVRFAASILVATLLWYGFERPILGLKRRFRYDPNSGARSGRATAPQPSLG